MHASEREKLILTLLDERGFIAFRDLAGLVASSPATIRRDLERLYRENRLIRVRGGIKAAGARARDGYSAMSTPHLAGVPFRENVSLNPERKAAIGRVAATLCTPGQGVMIDGGSTTLQMCPHLAGLNLQVLTNSLHIVAALIGQPGTRILVPSGAVFPEQNIILSVFGDDGMPRFHAPKLFMGAASIGPQGLMQADVVLVAGERRFIERADEVIVLVDSSKFEGPSGNVVCGLEEVDVVITDDGMDSASARMIEDAGIRLIIAT